MWLGSECIRWRYSPRATLTPPCHSKHHSHRVDRRPAALDESSGQAVRQFGVRETIRVDRRYGVSGGMLSSMANVTHFCHHSLESGLPLTVVEALYVGVNSKYPVATTAIYPLWMQFVVSLSHFTSCITEDISLGNQSRADCLAGRQKPLTL
jgi:hypothetical protein